MNRDELVQELKKRMAPTIPLDFSPCLRCGYDCDCEHQGCAIIHAAVLEIQLMGEEIERLKERIHDLERSAMTPQTAVNILRSADLGGVLRIAADMGIEALEREMGGTK